MKFNIILKNGRYALLECSSFYVVVSGYDENKPDGHQWEHGDYFNFALSGIMEKQRMLYAAIEAYRAKTEEHYIPRCRLEELATLFKDGMIEDDEETAKEYFDDICEMSQDEKDFFGICS